MSFFESFPEPPPPQEPPAAPPRPAWMKPVTALPAGVARYVTIAHDDRIAISIGGPVVYPNGFEFSLHIRSRDGVGPIDPFGYRRRRDYLPDAGREAPDPNRILRVGVEFADGRRTASNQRHALDPNADYRPGDLLLAPGAGGGGDRFWDLSYWVHPLPPSGPVSIVVSWLSQGIDEICHRMDGAEMLAEIERAVPLWPEDASGG